MSYSAKLTGEDLSRYLNQIESLGLKKIVLAPSRRYDCECLQMFTFSLPNIMAARTAGIDMNEEIGPSSSYVCYYLHFTSKWYTR